MTVDTKKATVTENLEKTEKHEVDLEQALAVAGLGCYNLKYCGVLALFLISAILEPLGYSYVLPAGKCDLQMTDAQRGFIASIPYIGVVLTSYPWGYMVDTQGRKRTAIYSSLATGGFGLLAAFMPELVSFIVFKFLSALCIAGPSAIPYSFIGELVPQKNRDLIMSVVNALQILGSAIVPLLAWGVLPLTFRVDFGLYEFRPWRLLVIVNASLFLVAATLMSFGPESPKFLVAQGKHDEALAVLQTMYAGNKRKSPEDYPVKRLKMPASEQSNKRGILASLKEQSVPLIVPPYFKWLILNGFLLFGVFSTLNGLCVWVPDILNRVITGSGKGLTACQVIALRLNETAQANAECNDEIESTTFVINTIANASCALIAVVGSTAVKIIGKKALLLTVFFLIGGFTILINFIYEDMVFATLLSSLPITGLAIGPINSFAMEIFPAHLRGMAISLSMMIGRFGSISGANIAGVLINASCESTFYFFGGLLVLCGLLSSLLPRSQPAPQQKRLSTHL